MTCLQGKSFVLLHRGTNFFRFGRFVLVRSLEVTATTWERNIYLGGNRFGSEPFIIRYK